MLLGCGDLGTNRPWRVMAMATALVALALVGVRQLRFGQNELIWFPEDEPLRVATEVLDRELQGIMNVEVLIRTGEENALHEPGRLREFEEIARSNESVRYGDLFIGKTISIADIIKEVHQAPSEKEKETEQH